MTLWFVFALMTAAAVFAVLWPLARHDMAGASGSDLEVYRDQLGEVRRDRAAGLIGEKEAVAAEVEVSRRLLAAADAQAAAPQPAPAETITRRRRTVSIAALLVLPIGAVALYLVLGSPSLPGQPLASRSAPERLPIEAMVAQVEALLAKNPNEARGWEVLAPIYLRMGRFDDAVNARRKALAISGESAERRAGLGEALTAAAGGVVTAEALAEFKSALALEKDNVRARLYLGLAAEQDGRIDDAATIWRALLADAPPGAPWAELVRSELNRVTGGSGANGAPAPAGSAPQTPAAPGPNDEQITAAEGLSAGQRAAMIRSMVDQLAAKLSRDGSDLEGWLRLVRSYMVLGEQDKAQGAVADARRALASDPEKVRRLDQFAKGLGLKG